MERTRGPQFQIAMSDEPGEYAQASLTASLRGYLLQDPWFVRLLRDVILLAGLERGVLWRAAMTAELVCKGAADDPQQAGRFVSLVSQQVGMAENDFLRQVIGYDCPDYAWDKDNYRIREAYLQMVGDLLCPLGDSEKDGAF